MSTEKIKYRTYDEILTDMLEEYEVKPESGSEEMVRLEIMCHEVFTLEKLIEEMERECFVSTATGEYLDRLANEYGLERKTALGSAGTLELSISNPIDSELSIPKGSVFASSEGIEFETIEDCVIEIGAVSVSVRAKSLLTGEETNSPAESIKLIVSAPSKLEYVRNSDDFLGGRDAEGDSEFRNRLLEKMSEVIACANEEFYRNIALENDSVSSVNVISPSVGEVCVYVWGNGDEVSTDEIEKIKSEYDNKGTFGVIVTVQNAKSNSVDLSVYISPNDGYTFDEAKADATEVLEEMFSLLSVGEDLSRADVVSCVMRKNSVKNVSLPSAFEDLSAEKGEIFTKGTITVREVS